MKSINSLERLTFLFNQLDLNISQSMDIYVIGGANLIAQNLGVRATRDIDVIFPEKFESELLSIIYQISMDQKIYEKWINTEPSRDAEYLNSGWRERAFNFYSGKKLIVWMIARVDMIGLKIAAALDRQIPDREDLLLMNPTEEEWEIGRIWARKYDMNPDWANFIDNLVKELKIQQEKKNGK